VFIAVSSMTSAGMVAIMISVTAIGDAERFTESEGWISLPRFRARVAYVIELLAK
jgi:hypothetical protein